MSSKLVFADSIKAGEDHIAQIARELGVSDTSIHQWRRELVEHGQEAFPGSGHQTALEEENRRRVSRAGARPARA